MLQVCGRCKEPKALEEYSAACRGHTGRWCRACSAAYQRGERGPSAPHPPVACDHCGADFVPKVMRGQKRYCSRACGQQARNASGHTRDAHLRRRYGITQADYDRMLNEQGGGCALCGRKAEGQLRYSTYLHVDHCHETGRVRGLLCDQHNLLLGRFDHDPDLLRRAADYLDR